MDESMPNYEYEVTQNTVIRRMNGAVSSEQGYLPRVYLNEERPFQFLPFGSLGRDLIRVGAAVLAADRLSLRYRPGTKEYTRDRYWSRRMILSIPVVHLERWESVCDELGELLHFLSDDHWTIEYRPISSYPQGGTIDFEAIRHPPPNEIALFSGGLDSVAGMWLRHQRAERSFIATSVYGSGKQKQLLTGALGKLRELNVNVRAIRIISQLRKPGPVEESQRTRGFTYLMCAGAIADALGIDCIATYEAGPGALNLRMCRAQVGSQNTRAMHPYTLHCMERILRRLLCRNTLRIQAPFFSMTKGEVCKATGPQLQSLANVSFSCDEGNQRKKTQRHCGVCTSCMLRRIALYSALRDDDPTEYRDKPKKGTGRFDVEAFHLQSLNLKAASADFHDLVRYDPQIRRAIPRLEAAGVTNDEAQALLCGLIHRHANEVLAFFRDTNFGIPSALPRRNK